MQNDNETNGLQTGTYYIVNDNAHLYIGVHQDVLHEPLCTMDGYMTDNLSAIQVSMSSKFPFLASIEITLRIQWDIESFPTGYTIKSVASGYAAGVNKNLASTTIRTINSERGLTWTISKSQTSRGYQ